MIQGEDNTMMIQTSVSTPVDINVKIGGGASDAGLAYSLPSYLTNIATVDSSTGIVTPLTTGLVVVEARRLDNNLLVAKIPVHIVSDEQFAYDSSTGRTEFSFPDGFAAIPVSQKGAPNGVASLGPDGLVPAELLPASSGGGISSVNGDSSSAVVLDTDDIGEGSTNLYFTPARFDAALAAAVIDAETLDGKTAEDFAEDDHNHDGVYAGVVHNHDSAYAPLSHDHDDDYRKKTDTAFVEMFAVADFTTLTPGEIADYKIISGGAKNIGKVVISSLSTPGSGGIEIDIKIKATPASAPTSIFSTKPVLTGNGGINWTVVTTDIATTTIPDGAMVIMEITDADGGQDLRLEIYE